MARQHLFAPTGWVAMPIIAFMAAFFPVSTGPVFLFAFLAVLPAFHHARATGFDRALPLHARVILEARLLAALGLLLLPVLVWAIALHLQQPGAWPLPHVLAVPCVMLMVSMTIYLSDGSPRRFANASFRTEVIARLTVLAAVVGAVMLALPARAALATLIVVAMAMYRWLRTNIPAAIPDDIAATERAAQPGSGVRSSASRSSLWRYTFPSKSSFALLAVVLVFAVMSGFDSSTWLFACLYVGGFFNLSKLSSRWLALLPLSHSTRLRLAIGPLLIAGVGGTAIGMAAGEYFSPEQYNLTMRSQTTFTPGEWRQSPSRVSLSYWHIAARHEQPVIVAPWGERVPADTVSAFGQTRFNPYTSRKSSSEQFIEWQFQRATEAVYGQSLTQAEYKALPARERPPSVMQQPAARVLLLGITLVVMLLSAWAFELQTWHRAIRWSRLPRNMLFVAAFIPTIALLFLPRWFVGGIPAFANVVVMESLCLAITQWLGNSVVLSLLVCAAAAFLAWRLLLWQFTQSEFETFPAGSARPLRATEPAQTAPLQNAA